MDILLNGEPRQVSDQASVRELLVELGLNMPGVAVEVNCDLVPHRLHEQTALAEGDRVEIVTLVGGG